ncbi:restriction endonuclease subunit S [Fibrobacter sp. UWB13]|uniref:restriction endonuclease subunit S n=1 Tax=Fibrobacter sp. UWB13 TaxID=1896204 RepID=UPI000A0BE2CC|nr:restriction endonuclease subunit S [Fibrobacter sp. UWB13]SMG17770.1 type I restriction enzyme, S subunit [Fibrobacter sp. UWB13]
MRKYARYKDSGISWIGEVPEHWETKRVGAYFNENKALNKDFIFKKAYQFKFGSLVLKNELGDEREYEDTYVKYTVLNENDIVFNGLNLNYDFVSQRVAICPAPGIITSAYIAMSPKNSIDSMYYLWLFKTMDNKKMLHGMGSGIRLTLSFADIKNQLIPIPPLSEQKAIAEYLDKKTAQINELVSAKQKQIELLKEYKQSVIANAVTGKLNKDCRMKDSGISWIGKIPENWEVKRIRHVFNESDEKITDNTGELLSLSQYTGVSLKRDCEKVGMFEAETTEGYKIVHKNQFVMNIMLAWNGSYAVSELEGVISPAYCVFNFIIDCVPKYFHYLLRLKAYAGAFKTLSKGIIDSRLRLYPSKFYTFPVIIPPLSEQKEIVAYIEKKVSSIDSQIASIENQIANLNEYKQSLISDVVTGKVKVC